MDKETAELLVRTGPGTPMGELMRRYWVPVLPRSEIAEPGRAPVRVQILGEKLSRFATAEGGRPDRRVLRAPRRLAVLRAQRGGRHPLLLPRPEVRPSRASASKCLQRRRSATAMRIKAYPCIERGGIVWAYMGPPDKQPAPPEARVVHAAREPPFRLQAPAGVQLPAGDGRRHRHEPRHLGAPLRGRRRPDAPRHQGEQVHQGRRQRDVRDRAKSDFGLTLFGRRNGEPDSYYWRITQWIFPWFTLIPPFGAHALGGHVWVPIDDENCWAWSINFRADRPLPAQERADMARARGSTAVRARQPSVRRANADND